MFDPRLPCNDLPILPPTVKLETEAVLRKLGDAKASLASLKEVSRNLPNPSVILQSIVLQEAKLSSEIENIFTTNDELYRQIDEDQASQSPAVKEIRRYRHALWGGYERLRQTGGIDVSLIRYLGAEILEKPVDFRTGSGTRIGSRRTGKVIYTPPEGSERIEGLLQNLVDFLQSSSVLDPLVKISVAHYQFEAIHPFPDGNGRTGRVLNILGIVQAGILDLPVLYLSHEFLENRRDYYDGLRRVTEQGDWEGWVLFFLECLESTAVVTRHQFRLVMESTVEAKRQVREELPRWMPIETVDLIYSKPYSRISDLVSAGIAKRQTAVRYLDALVDAGLLEKQRQWRESLYLNRRLMEILSLQPD